MNPRILVEVGLMMTNNKIVCDMNRIFYYLTSVLAASVVFAACNSTEIVEDTPDVGVKVLTAYTDSDISTKTSLNGVSVIWSESDKITAFEEAEKYIGRKADKNRKIYNGMMKTYYYSFCGPKPPRKNI